MIRRILSIRSRGRGPISRDRGFSLVELMMSVVLLAIGAALALPSYRDMVEKRQVTNAAEQIASFMNSAQGISMKRNRPVTVQYKYSGPHEWCVGATFESSCVCEDSASEDYCTIDSAGFVIDNSHTGNLDVMRSMGSVSTGTYNFEPIRGLASGTVLPLTMELQSPGGDFRLNLQVNETGRVILCSDDVDHAIPGYDVCT
ncbi:MAG: GspH/FimT family pseudopilin [Lysobacterales bacterium]